MITPSRFATTYLKMQIERGDQHQQDGDLADLDPDIEAEQCGHQVIAGKLERLAEARMKSQSRARSQMRRR